MATRRVVVRYRVKPDEAERNAELVRGVYEELHRAKPARLRYRTFRLEDGVSFVHIAETEGGASPLAKLESFKEFQREIEDRCEEQPVVMEATEIGSFRFRSD